MAKGTTPLNKFPRTGFGDLVVDTQALGTGAVTANEIAASTITGVQLSATQRNGPINKGIPTVATTGTTEVCVVIPFAGTVTGVNVAFKDALTRDATNFLSIFIKNKGQAGAGTTDILAATDTNTTKTSTGRAIAAYTVFGLALNATPANLVVAANDVLAIQFVSAATLANTLTEGDLAIGLDITA